MAEQVLESDEFQHLPTSWSQDDVLVFNRYDSSNNVDVWVLMPGTARETRPFLASEFTEGSGVISPDGRWIAYVSDRTGRFEVYVSPFPGGGREVPITNNGGREPRWSPDGGELVYRGDQALISVPLSFSPDVSLGMEFALFEDRFSRRHPREYDVAPDGRFLFLEAVNDLSSPAELIAVDGWFAELERLFEADQD